MNEKKSVEKKSSGKGGDRKETKRPRKTSEYGRQLEEKQKIKSMYGMQERQFRRFFANALKMQGASGENLLSLLERRLDNVVFRIKFAVSRRQARILIVHGHILVNGKKVYTPSYLISKDDLVSLAPNVEKKSVFLETVIDKRLQTATKVPDWLEVDKKGRVGRVLRLPVRSDIHIPIEEHLIVELYSK